MSFLAELWREVGRHLELEESVRRIAPMLARRLPLDLLVVRRLDRDPMRLTTVASAVGHASGGVETHATRSECEPRTERELLRFLGAEQAEIVTSEPPSALAGVLLPNDLSGAAVVFPLLAENGPLGVALLFAQDARGLRAEHLEFAQSLLEPLSVAFENDLRLHELARMREALEADRRALLSRLDRQDITDTVVGDSAGLHSVMERVEQVAKADAPVLILGETGSGKEVIARSIHARSRRARGPVVRVNCGAIPAQLIDSELFGHERGSFTGAVAQRKGWFERADGGTLFLDEIGELPLEAQVRLLRVLQDGSLERVGGHQAITVDVRIVAATHRNLEIMVAEGTFREDLWYRISVFPIRLPALRERPQDIQPLATHFAHKAGQRLGGAPLTPNARDVSLLASYAWPGNVRELATVIERAAILGDGKRLEIAKALGTFDPNATVPAALVGPRPTTVPPPSAAPIVPPPLLPVSMALPTNRANDDLPSLDTAMVVHIEQALKAAHGRIEGPFGAARMLGINPHTLRARMRKLHIEWSRFRAQ